MVHPRDTTFHGLRTTSKIDATPIQTALDSIPGKGFHRQQSVSQDGLYIVVDCKSENTVDTYSQLTDFIEDRGDLPAYITDNDGGDFSDMTKDEGQLVVGTRGASGSAWDAADISS